MPVMLNCVSHTPVMNSFGPAAAIEAEARAALAQARRQIEAFAPDLVVLFGPDHFNTFFYDTMPAFCIGAQASSVGDYGTGAGPLTVPTELAVACAAAVLAAEVDTALSYAMRVDHGFAQPLELLTGAIDRYPVLPVFINCVGAPLAPCRRAIALGAAIGAFLAAHHAEQRILILGSGGLSHDPPVPALATAPEPLRSALIDGTGRSPAEQRAHEARVVAAAHAFTETDPVLGGGRMLPLNPDWDRQFLDRCCRADFAALGAMTDAEMAAQAGRGAGEVRTWLAALACLRAYGAYTVEVNYYRPIPEWIAGFALMTGKEGWGGGALPPKPPVTY